MAFVKDDDRLLRVLDLSISFGGIDALKNIQFDIRRGEIYSIIGPNGAGKTTLFNCINCIYRTQQGDIWFDGQRISGLKPHKIAQMGIARAFQNIELFRGMTVLDNLMSAQGYKMKYGVLEAAVFFGRCLKYEVHCRDYVEEIIEFLDLENFRKKPVASLSYGLQKRVELGRALAMKPKLLLIDEPVSGMNSEETEDMARYLLDVNEEMNITIALVEHEMGLVMDLSDRIMVLNFGNKIAEGSPREVAENPDVIQAYLGESHQA